MQIFLTGATKFGDSSLITKSLGGYISSSEPENDNLNAVFAGISEYGKSLAGKAVYRVFAIKNESDTVTYTNVKLWIDTITNDESDVLDIQLATFQVGIQDVQTDSCGDLLLPKLATQYSKPFSTTMVSVDGVDNAIDLDDLEPGLYRGIVISRTINKDAIDCDQISDDQLQSIYIDNILSLATEEKVELHISYDEV